MINIYSTPTCNKCKTIKMYCQKSNIKFNDIDITNNTEALNKLKNLKLLQLPVIEKGNEIYSLTHMSEIREIINKWNEGEKQ